MCTHGEALYPSTVQRAELGWVCNPSELRFLLSQTRQVKKGCRTLSKILLRRRCKRGFWNASPRYSKGKPEGLSGEPLRAAAPLTQQKPARVLRQRRWQGVLWEHLSRERELVGWLDYLLPCCFWYGAYLSRHGRRNQGQPYE